MMPPVVSVKSLLLFYIMGSIFISSLNFVISSPTLPTPSSVVVRSYHPHCGDACTTQPLNVQLVIMKQRMSIPSLSKAVRLLLE